MKNIATIALVAAACIAPGGCTPGQTAKPLAPVDRKIPLPGPDEKIGQKYNNLCEKYAALADRCMKLVKENKDLADKNLALAATAAADKSELEQAKKELADANAVIHQLSQDLKDWQKNVLGFRDEIRKAQTLQIQKIVDIIRLLGGETAETPGKTAVKTDGAAKKGGTPNGTAG